MDVMGCLERVGEGILLEEKLGAVGTTSGAAVLTVGNLKVSPLGRSAVVPWGDDTGPPLNMPKLSLACCCCLCMRGRLLRE